MRRRTNAAVAKWLEKQEWYEAWLDNMNLQDLDEVLILEYKYGLHGKDTISNSFIWMVTPEGYDYWKKLTRNLKLGFMAMNKTPEEVSEWLKNQKWLREFVRTMRDSHTSRKTATQIVNGELGALTIAAAFGWEDSPQGLKYWHEKHKELIEWYYG